MASDESEPGHETSIYTIGHSTRSLEQLIEILKSHDIEKLIDIRTVPRSATNPQFNRETFPAALAAVGMDYAHVAALGGLRKPRPQSINTAWKNASFRGYADYMQTGQFAAALEDLIEAGRRQRVSIMCAEAVPWRCHRNLVADALLARGVQAVHIMDRGKSQPHKLTRFARLDGNRVIYPAEAVQSG